MTLQLIGLLLEVKPTESTNKKTSKVTEHTEIQVIPFPIKYTIF